MNILGLSAYYHDSAAALLQDGAVVAAAQEERFSRKKHDARFPEGAGIGFVVDGQPIITQETGNVIFLKAVQAAIHHSKTQLIRRFYSYSFALEPEKWYPTGQINFSLIKEQILNLSLTPCADYARQFRVYALSHNILRVSEGTARTLFDVKY